MYMIVEVSQYVAVASFSEAWIEIISSVTQNSGSITVASFSEAWIEIRKNKYNNTPILRRLLLGGVD